MIEKHKVSYTGTLSLPSSTTYSNLAYKSKSKTHTRFFDVWTDSNWYKADYDKNHSKINNILQPPVWQNLVRINLNNNRLMQCKFIFEKYMLKFRDVYKFLFKNWLFETCLCQWDIFNFLIRFYPYVLQNIFENTF